LEKIYYHNNMATQILDYIKNKCISGYPPTEWITPEVAPHLMSALGLTKEFESEELSLANLPVYIDQRIDLGRLDDATFMTSLLNDTKFNTGYLSVEMLAEFAKSGDLPKLDKDIKLKGAQLMKSAVDDLENENIDADYVVMNSIAFADLIGRVGSQDKQAELIKKINERYEYTRKIAEGIKDKVAMLKFRAIPLNTNKEHWKRNLKNLFENIKTVWGENVAGLQVELYNKMYEDSANDYEKQVKLDGFIMAFEMKLMALRRAWGLADDEAPLNHMVEV